MEGIEIPFLNLTPSKDPFTRSGISVLINLQPEKSNRAKAYQIRQVRAILVAHNL